MRAHCDASESGGTPRRKGHWYGASRRALCNASISLAAWGAGALVSTASTAMRCGPTEIWTPIHDSEVPPLVRTMTLGTGLKAEVLGKSVLHADETPVRMLKRGAGKTHRVYLWAYTPTSYDSLRAVLYDFASSRAGEHCRTFLEDWRGKLVTDDYAGYKAGFAAGITEMGCMAHARRKFHDLHANNQSHRGAGVVRRAIRRGAGRSRVVCL